MNAARMTRRWHLGKVSIAMGVAIGGSLVLLAATRVFGWPAATSAAKPAAERAALGAVEAVMASLPGAPPTARPDPIEQAMATLAQRPGTPEARLIAAYRLLAQARLDDALQATQALVNDQPNFRLAHLFYADLLMTRSGQPAAFASTQAPGGEELANLRQEAAQRLAALVERPPADAVPAPFVQLPASTRHAIAVDVSRSRLYLFAHEQGSLRLINDYYVSVGKQGADKLVEGDQKTPLGVYHTLESIDPKLLEDRFGSAALPLNYPNALDRTEGRTGSGILLHGVPSDTYVRAPQATDGCVALANDDLLRIAATINPRYTPVVIARQLPWVAPQQAQAGGRDFLAHWQAWEQARVNADAGTLVGFYDQRMEPPASAPVITVPARKKQPARTVAVTGYVDVSVMAVADPKPMMVVNFRERGPNGERSARLKQQYWAEEAGRWRIIAES